jgi:hypothetical protein
VWDIFSDQNEVIAQDGRVIHLGTLRGAGDFLAEFSKRQTGRREFDYMSFYLGTSAPWAETEDDLTQIYELVFHRLKRRELDWVYHFPRIHLVDFQPLREALDSKDKPEWTDYSPSDAFAKGAADQQREREIAEFRDHLEADRNAAIEEALQKPAPSRVCAYRNVFGSWPTGWPPSPGD